MTVEDALKLNGSWVRLMLEMCGEDISTQGQIVGVVVPAPDSGVDAHILLSDGRSVVSPCGVGLEVFLSDIVTVVWWGEGPLEPRSSPLLRLVR